MTDWNSPETAPKNRKILVYGQPEDVKGDNAVKFYAPGIHLAMWDGLDEAFCLDGGGWLGPFIKPLAWTEAPSKPTSEVKFK